MKTKFSRASQFTADVKFKKECAQSLRKIRLEHGISLSELKFISGISKSHLSALETGDRAITLRLAWLLGAVYDMTPSQILFPEGESRKDPELKDIRRKCARFLKGKDQRSRYKYS